MESFATEYDVQVDNNTDYHLSINVGEWQKGYSSFKNIDGTFASGNIKWVKIGKGSNLKGKSIRLTIMITDTNPYTNNTSLSVLVNQTSVHGEPLTKEIETDYASIIYYIKLNFN